MNENNQEQTKLTVERVIRKVLGGIAALDTEKVLVIPENLRFSLNFTTDGALCNAPTGITADFGLRVFFRPEDITRYPGGLHAFCKEYEFIDVAEIESVFDCKSSADTEKAAFHELSENN